MEGKVPVSYIGDLVRAVLRKTPSRSVDRC